MNDVPPRGEPAAPATWAGGAVAGAGGAVVMLHHAGRPVAAYCWSERPDPVHVPRPHLCDVRTLAGTPVCAVRPEDHRHHLGVSVAVPDLSGVNFWGGRTFVRAQGPTELDNHGLQRHDAWLHTAPGAVTQALTWLDPAGVELLRERRGIAVHPVDPRSWALDWTFELTNVTAEPLTFASPACNGRPGAGYGGFFWRAPQLDARPAVTGAGHRTGVRGLHGRCAPWCALSATGRAAGVSSWTLVFVAADERTRCDRWFVRTADYLGVGSSLAWDTPLLLLRGETLRRRVITVVVDGTLPPDEADALAARQWARAQQSPILLT